MGYSPSTISFSFFLTRTNLDEIDNKEILPSGNCLLYCQSLLLGLFYRSDQPSVYDLCTRSESPTSFRPSNIIITSTTTVIVSKRGLSFNLSTVCPLLTSCLPLGFQSWAVCCNHKYVNTASALTHNTPTNQTHDRHTRRLCT